MACFTLALCAVGVRPDESVPDAVFTDTVDFGTQVRPILVRSCLACHGFDPSTREADLRLDTFEGATADRRRGNAIVPGAPEKSVLIERVTSTDHDERMPLEAEPLSKADIAILRQWIAEGAQYEQHWSLEPVGEPAVPEVEDATWKDHAIDAFVRARLDAVDLVPAGEADRRTLIRRLSFDLTGLPPTPEEVRAFEQDDSPEAYADLVDRLLASPAFGERWARHWLDLVRYAETYAHEFDYPIRHAFEYRDYVIRALNADVPYDQIVTEHIAGDLLANPRMNPDERFNESIIGTGFWWMSEGTHAPVDVRLDEALRIDNQIDVFSKAFLATTVSCARCHDHKFDPILTKEYYGLAGFLQSSRRQEAYLDPGGRIEAAIAALSDHQMHDWLRLHQASEQLPVDFDPASHLALGAAEVMFGEPGVDEVVDRPLERPFEDFDGDSYDGWTVVGDAFAEGPTKSGEGRLAAGGTAVGHGFADSHVRTESGSSPDTDAKTGKLVSASFVIRRGFLHFLIGGGHHPGKTGLRVLVDGKVVGEATGSNTLNLVPGSIDLSAYRGQDAVIEIFDDATGGWGNIRVDELVFSNAAVRGQHAQRSVAAVAAERNLDPEALGSWVEAFMAFDDGRHDDVLAAFSRLASQVGGDAEAVVGHLLEQPDRPNTGYRSFERFDQTDGQHEWFASGWGFTQVATPMGMPIWHDGQRSWATTSMAWSGSLSDRLMGTLRSPTFEIVEPFIMTRAKGRGTLRVIVDGYTMDEYNALLFGGMKQDVESDDWRWIVHDVRKFVGHRAHYEIIDDRLDGSIAVDDIVFGQSNATPDDEGVARLIRRRYGGEASLADVAQVFSVDATLQKVGVAVDRLDVHCLNSLSEHQLLGSSEASDPAVVAAYERIENDIPEPRRVTAIEDGSPEDERVFIRGNHLQLGEVAPRGFLGVLCDDASIDGSSGSGRLQLAERVLDESNPMTTRVIVNRVWHHLFGRGLVESTDDFGLLGSTPTHPELLDHLASRFRDEMGWSIKSLIRAIVLTKTYRMASGSLEGRAAEVDPLNQMLSVRTVRRLEGETIRDAVLAVSGRLDETMYGRSVPVHLTDFMTGRGRPGKSGPIDGDGRRSVYLEVRRNFLEPMMQAFDAPNPHSAMGKRSRSNVPAQSLILMNSPFMIGQAEVLADRLLHESESTRERVDLLYWLALSRSPREEERSSAIRFLDDQAASHRALLQDDVEAVERQVWVDLCHVVLNLKEFIFVE